jgi:hypothetical protein
MGFNILCQGFHRRSGYYSGNSLHFSALMVSFFAFSQFDRLKRGVFTITGVFSRDEQGRLDSKALPLNRRLDPNCAKDLKDSTRMTASRTKP